MIFKPINTACTYEFLGTTNYLEQEKTEGKGCKNAEEETLFSSRIPKNNNVVDVDCFRRPFTVGKVAISPIRNGKLGHLAFFKMFEEEDQDMRNNPYYRGN